MERDLLQLSIEIAQLPFYVGRAVVNRLFDVGGAQHNAFLEYDKTSQLRRIDKAIGAQVKTVVMANPVDTNSNQDDGAIIDLRDKPAVAEPFEPAFEAGRDVVIDLRDQPTENEPRIQIVQKAKV